ncbi:MAG TPA: MlaD family protein [Actinomycetota bacterium]|nr:MlaD family protein [Actinomycetota bacterium]
MRRLLTSLVVAFTVATLASACGGGPKITVQAKFTDVGSLATQAPVMLNDVKVGEVTNIKLDGNLALVTMSLEQSADVPRGVQARIRSTSLLGERIMDLVIPDTLPSTAPPLADGAMITDTSVRPELEDLVRSGTDVLAPVVASEVATLVDEGAKGFAGQGQDLHQLLSDLTGVVHAYAGATDDIRSLIGSLNEFNTTLAKDATAHGLSVQNTDRAISELQQESDELQAAIHSLTRLARGAKGIFDAHFDEMNRFFEQFRIITGVLASEQASIAGLLEFAPNHNRNTQLVEYQEFNQIFQDFVICGLNDDPSDPARTCENQP